MFFIFGITNGEKQLDFYQNDICSSCGSYTTYHVFVTYMVFTLFFIPLFKFSKKYYVKSTCCNNIYSLSPAIGKKIEHGKNVKINPEDLTVIYTSKRCKNCGYTADKDFNFCPKCGGKL